MKNKITRWKLSKEELAYIAGIIDADGYLGISRNTTKKQRQRSPKYQSEICVINTDKRLMDWFEKRVGGLVNARIVYGKNDKVSYRWRIKESCHPDFLKMIIPCLVIKQRQAELIVEYWSKKTKSYRQGRKWQMPDEEKELRAHYHQELKKLNARGNREYQQRLIEATPL